MRRKTFPTLFFIWLAIAGGIFWWWQGRDEEKEIKEVKEKSSLIKESGPAALVLPSFIKEEPKEEPKEEYPYLEQKKEATEENISPQKQEEKEEKFKATASVIDQHGEAVKKADFWLRDSKGNKYGSGETNQAGYLEIDITSIPEGNYTLYIKKVDWDGLTKIPYCDTYEKEITITKEDTDLGTLSVHKWSKITGLLVNQSGEPVGAMIRFEIIDSQGHNTSYYPKYASHWGFVNSEGWLETRPLPDGSYTLRIKQKEIKEIKVQISGDDIYLGEITI